MGISDILVKQLIGGAIFFIRRLMDKQVANKIQALVVAAFGTTGTTGAEKKADVDAQLANLRGSIGEALAETSGWLIDSLISTTVGQYKIVNNLEKT